MFGSGGGEGCGVCGVECGGGGCSVVVVRVVVVVVLSVVVMVVVVVVVVIYYSVKFTRCSCNKLIINSFVL